MRFVKLALLVPFAFAPLPAQTAASADAPLKAIYTADEAWARAQRGDGPGGNDAADEDDARGKVMAHLPRVDPATQAAKLAHWTGTLAQLDALDPAALSPAEHLNFEVFRAQLVVLVQQQTFRDFEMPANSDSAFWSDQAGPARDPFRRAEDYKAYIARLNDTPRFFAEEIANMRAGLARGFTPPRVTLAGRDVSIRAVAEAPAPEATAYYKPFETMPASIPAEERQALRKQGAAAIRDSVQPAFRTLLAFWNGTYVPGATVKLAASDLPDGARYYQAKIREYTTTELTPAQIHQTGLDEMAKIHAEMLATMRQTGFVGDLPAFLQFLRTDPSFYAKTPEELLMRAASIAKEFDGVSSRYFGYLPRQRFAIKPVPADIAPFYTSARGGAAVYWVNTFDLPSRGLYSLPALTLHESAPGHSLQLSIAQEHAHGKEALPKFRNAYISAYGEGWALYCERLGVEWACTTRRMKLSAC